jgi:hypothetical protein
MVGCTRHHSLSIFAKSREDLPGIVNGNILFD